MIGLLIVILSANIIEFDIDPIVYRTTVTMQDTVTKTITQADLFYLEMNCGIPFNELHYEEIDSVNIARAVIAFKLVNLTQPDSLIDTLFRQFSVPSFKEALRQGTTFIVQFGLHVAEGEYMYMLTMTSGNKQGTVEKELTITKDQYRLSDILLASEIVSDTLGDYLRKGNLKVIPRPSHNFTANYQTIYLYYEIYDIEPDSGTITVTYTITDTTGKVIRKIPQTVKKLYRSQALNLGINIEGLDAGDYTITVSLSGEEIKTVASKQTSFHIIKHVETEISYEGMPYYEKVEYFLSENENKLFESLPPEGKHEFLKRFWSTRDYFDIAERFEYADEHFQEGAKRGYRTERGRIYIKYGVPDDWGKSTIEIEESKPYEHWQYFTGIQFVFVDIRSTNEYTLVWTDAEGERSQPTLYKYLPRSLREQIE